MKYATMSKKFQEKIMFTMHVCNSEFKKKKDSHEVGGGGGQLNTLLSVVYMYYG